MAMGYFLVAALVILVIILQANLAIIPAIIRSLGVRIANEKLYPSLRR